MSNVLTADKYLGSRGYSWYKQIAEDAEAHGHKFWVDGIPVVSHLVPFVREFRAKRRNALLRVVGNPTYREYVYDAVTGDRSYLVWNSVGISFPELPDQGAGKLKYDVDKKAYVVDSRLIINERYRSGSDDYNTKRSTDMVKSVKAAMQYLKPLSFDEIVSQNNWKLTGALDAVRDPARRKLRDVFMVTDKEDVMTEVKNMIATGYQPASASFRKAIDMMIAEGSELKRLEMYKPRTCFVWSMPDRMAYRFSDEATVNTVNDIALVPEIIRDKLAVLSLANDDTTIPDVGHRINAALHWVFV